MKKFLLSISALLAIESAFAQTYEWVQQIGSNTTSNEFGYLTVADKNGHIYVMSDFMNTIDADPGPAVLEMTVNGTGSSDKCIQKLNLDGTLVWAKQFGGSSSENLNSFDIDENGDLYLTGTFSGSMDFDMGAGTNLQTAADPKSAFITKFDDNGDLIWVKTMRAKGNVYYGSLEFDSSNNLYHSFIFSDSIDVNTDPIISDFEYSTPNYRNMLLKLDSNGDYQWHKMLDSAYVYYHDIAISNDRLFFAGEIGENTVDVDPGIGITLLTPIDNQWDAFYGELDLDGNLLWVKQVAGVGGDYMENIEIDEYGNLVIIGLYTSDSDFNYGGTPLILPHISSDDSFVFKCTSEGNPIWLNPIAGTDTQYPYALAIDNSGNIYVGGMYVNTFDLDPGVETFNLTSLGLYDGFIAKYHPDGSLLNGWSVGGTGQFDAIYSISVDEEENVYATGRFGNTITFNTQIGSVDLTSTGGMDGFTFKLSCSPIDNSVTVDVNDFAAVETAAIAYQWYDCNTGLAMPGETAPIYTATDVLNVAVSITMDNNGCVAVSDCIDILSVDDLEISTVTIYPNPSTDKFTIEAENGIDQLAVYSMAGELILMEKFAGTAAAELTPQLNPGVYLVKVTDAAGNLHITQWMKL